MIEDEDVFDFTDKDFCMELVQLYIAAIILWSESEGMSQNEAHEKVSDWLEVNEIHGQLDSDFANGKSTLH